VSALAVEIDTVPGRELNTSLSRNAAEVDKMETDESFIPGKTNRTKEHSCKSKSLLCQVKPWGFLMNHP